MEFLLQQVGRAISPWGRLRLKAELRTKDGHSEVWSSCLSRFPSPFRDSRTPAPQ